MKLIQTKDYLLLIDEEADIKLNDIVFEIDYKEIGVFNSVLTKYPISKSILKLVAYYPLTKEAKEFDLPLLPNPFENEIDVEQLSLRYYFDLEEKREKAKNFKGQVAGRHPNMLTSREMYAAMSGFVDGYKAAQSKQFNLEDMYRVAIEVANRVSRPKYGETININEIVDTYVQSLSTQQLPKVFIPEYEKDITNGWSNVLGVGDGKPKFKTITNSEGKQEIQGKYVY